MHEQLMYLTLWVHLLDKPPLWLIVRSIIVEMYEQCGYDVLWHIYAMVCERVIVRFCEADWYPK